jgi:hypothetical protein
MSPIRFLEEANPRLSGTLHKRCAMNLTQKPSAFPQYLLKYLNFKQFFDFQGRGCHAVPGRGILGKKE